MGIFKSRTPFKVDRNGTQYFMDDTCPRCGGAGGSDAWKYTGFTCYECGGSGHSRPRVIKVYTPEYEQKLRDRRMRAQEKKDAKLREEAPAKNREFFARYGLSEDGKAWAILGDTFAVKDALKELGCRFRAGLGWYSSAPLDGYKVLEMTADEMFETDIYGAYIPEVSESAAKKIKAANDSLTRETDTSEYLGEIGKKIIVDVTLDRINHYTLEYCRWGSTMSIISFLDKDGNTIVWKTGTVFSREVDGVCKPCEIGDKLTILATVKEHSVYRGRKQTVVTRVKAV